MIKRIHFKDQGQDFDYFDIDSNNGLARVIDSQPFQSDIWCKMFAINFKDLKVGGFLTISEAPDKQVLNIKYPIIKIETVDTFIYRGYNITEGGLGYDFVHPDYDGAPDSGDYRCGSAKNVVFCKEQIEEIIEEIADKSLVKL